MTEKNKNLELLYEDKNLLVVDKPASLAVYQVKKTREETLAEKLIEKFPSLKDVGNPPRYGIVHRLDKETSGVILVAKNNETLNFLQKEFKGKRVEKKYLALVVGDVEPQKATIETLIGRGPKDRRKQRVYLPLTPESQKKGLRKSKTHYRVLKKFSDKKTYYSLLELIPETGRKHQLRAHLAYLHHPLAGDRLYKFKGQPLPSGLKRHFLHAHYLKVKLPSGQEKEFISGLPRALKDILRNLKEVNFKEN